MGKRRRGLLTLQSSEGQLFAASNQHVSGSKTHPAERGAVAQKRPLVPAELPARKLAGLSLLGYRARSLNPATQCCHCKQGQTQ